jgi:hypothetical protein
MADPAAWVRFDLPADCCPACRKPVNAATTVMAARQPQAGDVTICLGCATVLAFDAGLKMRLLTEAELEQLRREPIWEHVVRVRAALREGHALGLGRRRP